MLKWGSQHPESNTLKQRSPTSRPWTSNSCKISGSIILETKCIISVMGLNHSKTIPHSPDPSPWKKLFSTEHVQLCPTHCDPMDCSLPGSSVHGILWARILQWVAMPSSRGSSRPMDWTHVSCVSYIGRQILSHWATWKDPTKLVLGARRFETTALKSRNRVNYNTFYLHKI